MRTSYLAAFFEEKKSNRKKKVSGEAAEMLIGVIVALLCFQFAFWMHIRFYGNEIKD